MAGVNSEKSEWYTPFFFKSELEYQLQLACADRLVLFVLRWTQLQWSKMMAIPVVAVAVAGEEEDEDEDEDEVRVGAAVEEAAMVVRK